MLINLMIGLAAANLVLMQHVMILDCLYQLILAAIQPLKRIIRTVFGFGMKGILTLEMKGMQL